MQELCKTLKNNLVCKYDEYFSTIHKLDSLEVRQGIITLNGYNGTEGQYVVLCGDSWYCETDTVLSSGIVHGVHKLETSNTIKTKYEYANFDSAKNNYVLDNIRISIVQNEQFAFNIFKANPNNYIFIMPIGSSTDNKELNSYITKTEKFKIIVILYDAKDINQFNNMTISREIENDIISGIMDDFIFINSQYAFSTANTTILEMSFNRLVELVYEKEPNCYLMTLIPPLIKIDELEKVIEINET